MASPGRVAAIAAIAALVVGGCANIPTDGAVHTGRVITGGGGLDEVDVRFQPPPPQPGMSPTDIARGFLRALVSNDGDYEIARSYLTARAAATWDSQAGVTTYDDGGVDILLTRARNGTRTVEIRAPRVGRIDARGDFTPASGRVVERLSLTRQSGQWRIDGLPRGVLLSALDAQRSFRLADIYYLNHAGTTMVPEQVLIRPELHGLTTALVRALLNGPGRWLGPAVRTAVPRGTQLIGNVPVDISGTAEVNLSAPVRTATPVQLRQLAAQVGWTLRQVSEVVAIRLLADGAPLAVPGLPLLQPAGSWSSFDPARPSGVAAAVFAAGSRVRVLGATGAQHAVGTGGLGLFAPALSSKGRTLAALGPAPSGTSLYVGRFGERPERLATATTITPPEFDPAGDLVVMVSRGSRSRLLAIGPRGRRMSLGADAVLLREPVQHLRFSPDGARVAAIVGPAGAGRLVIGRVRLVHGRMVLDGFRDVLPDVSDVRGVAWPAADEVVVTAPGAGGREVLGVDVDGYGTRTIGTPGVRGAPVDVAVAPHRPMLVVAAGEIWVDTGTWHRAAAGAEPAYAH